MNCYGIVLLCFALAAVCSAEKHEVENLKADVQVIDDITKYIAQHPGVEVLSLDEEVQPLGQIRYTLGRRAQGDRIVAQGNNRFSYPTLQDVRLNLNYPQSGLGAYVTYVEIIADQSSNDGKAYIVGGGIGQRNIAIVVEARRTMYFGYQAAIFGY